MILGSQNGGLQDRGPAILRIFVCAGKNCFGLTRVCIECNSIVHREMAASVSVRQCKFKIFQHPLVLSKISVICRFILKWLHY